MTSEKCSSPLPIIHRIEATDGGVISRSIARSLDGRCVGVSQLSPFEARMIGPQTASLARSESQNMLWKRSGSSIFKPENQSETSNQTQQPQAPSQIVEIEIRKSSFMQTLINAINVLLGIGILSLPYAFSKGGYVTMVVLAGVSVAAGYTAHLLGAMQRDIIMISGAITKSGESSACNGTYKINKDKSTSDRTSWIKLNNSWKLYWEHDQWHVVPQDVPSPSEKTSFFKIQEVGYSSVITTNQFPLRNDQTPFTNSDWIVFGKEDTYQKITTRDSSTYFSLNLDCLDISSPRIDHDETVNTFIHRGSPQEEQQQQDQSLGPTISTLDQYVDMGLASFGTSGCLVLKILFFLELFLFLVSAIIVMKENVAQISNFLPGYAMTLCVGVVVWPTAMVRDFSMLSWLSFVGFLSCFVLLSSVVYTAFVTTKADPPGQGNIINHATDQEVFIFKTLSLSFSLIMSSFGGHSLFPVLRSDMQDPSEYGKVVSLSFSVTALYCCVIGILGYIMFGEGCKDVIVLNYPTGVVTNITAASIAAVCFSKFGISFNALCLDLERSLSSVLGSRKQSWHLFAFRCFMMISITGTAILIPHFGVLMSLVGAAISCSISLIFPCLAYLRLCGSELSTFYYYSNVAFIAIAVYFAITGTINSVGVDL